MVIESLPLKRRAFFIQQSPQMLRALCTQKKVTVVKFIIQWNAKNDNCQLTALISCVRVFCSSVEGTKKDRFFYEAAFS